jgi:hypothetical protein
MKMRWKRHVARIGNEKHRRLLLKFLKKEAVNRHCELEPEERSEDLKKTGLLRDVCDPFGL